MNCFAWQTNQWRRLTGDREKLAHALLLAGPPGVGKWHFAQALAAHLLCEGRHPDAAACGICNSCAWLAAGSHPDFRLVQPEISEGDSNAEDATDIAQPPSRNSTGQIRIGQIRALEDFVFLGSHRHGSRIVLLAPAEAMNIAAANALLKLLEEPPPGVYFILVSSQPRRLLPTVLSRCQRTDFGRPEKAGAQVWLEGQGISPAEELLDLAAGAPLTAVDWAAQGLLEPYRKAIAVLADRPVDPVAMAAQWGAIVRGGNGLGLPELVDMVQKWLLDLALIKLAGSCRYHVAWRAQILRLAAEPQAASLLACYNDLLRIKAVVTHPLNSQLFLEDMAARYLRAMATRT